ncbi:hypothetical protein CDAR_41331 [Caerostris darwini]|uniref:Uncharacterized protein n=1 Tax=Caerostris darwini TaxID=1538125 RepID=A0AAV4SM33_9ARAC|nr:hypothetical protein CDAR_41331 [Caerostris darwini]
MPLLRSADPSSKLFIKAMSSTKNYCGSICRFHHSKRKRISPKSLLQNTFSPKFLCKSSGGILSHTAMPSQPAQYLFFPAGFPWRDSDFPLTLTCVHGSELIPLEFSLLGPFVARLF